jgi:hypothetical protein
MRQEGTRDPSRRFEIIGAYFRDEEKGMAFVIRMECMREMNPTPKAASFSTKDPKTGLWVSSLGLFHAAALAPLHWDDDNQYFDGN